MVRGVKLMRAHKKARSRRPMSPDQYQIALLSTISTIKGLCGYHWCKSFCKRGYPSVRIVILLGDLCGAAEAQATVDFLFRELDDMMVALHVVVTFSVRAFRAMCSQSTLSSDASRSVSHNNDDDDPDGDDDDDAVDNVDDGDDAANDVDNVRGNDNDPAGCER